MRVARTPRRDPQVVRTDGASGAPAKEMPHIRHDAAKISVKLWRVPPGRIDARNPD